MTVIIQRPLKGSRISSFYPVRSLPPLSALDSAFQLQEYISLLIRLDVHDVERIVSIPGKGANDSQDGEAKGEDKDPEKDASGSVNVDEACWVYEQLRRLAQDLSHPLITMLQSECTRSTCPEMKAGEWLYLCVAHGNEGAMEQCCAIDYILHTLDSATALLNSPRAFPSRLSVPSTSHRHFSSLARRLGRIFAHAYFHHREAFEQAEAESSLYARFLALTSKFDLVPAEFLVIPPRLTAMGDDGRPDHVEPPRLLGASLDPNRNLSSRTGDDRSWSTRENAGRDGLADRGTSTSSPAPSSGRRNDSPRKFGRNRTDTMVYSEAFSVAEELAKGDLSEVDIDREIAAERAAAAVDADLPTSAVPVTSTSPPPPPEDEPEETAPGESEQHDEPKEEATLEKTEPEPQNEAAEERSEKEEPESVQPTESTSTEPESISSGPESISSGPTASEESEEPPVPLVEADAEESHEKPAPKVTEESTSPSQSASEAPPAETEVTEEAPKEEEDEADEEAEEEEEEEGEGEGEGSDEEEESSDDDSDVSSTVVGVVDDLPVPVPPAEQKEAVSSTAAEEES